MFWQVVTMYRKRMANLIMAIKADIKRANLHQLLADYEPPKPEIKKDLVQLAKEVQSSFQPASAVSTNGSLPKAKGGFKLKREKNTQRSLREFVTVSSATPIEVDEKVKANSDVIENSAPEDEETTIVADSDKVNLGMEDKICENADGIEKEARADEHHEVSASSCTPYASEIQIHNGSSSVVAAVDGTVDQSHNQVTKLEEKISELSQAMREGMDQIEFVQKERQHRKQHSKDPPDSSPTSSHGHRPAEAPKLRKQKMADDFIQALLPYMKKERIGSKGAFKVLARELTHKALAKEERRGKSVKAADVVGQFFALHARIQSEDEAKAKLKIFRL
jgi:hypothetical protein